MLRPLNVEPGKWDTISNQSLRVVTQNSYILINNNKKDHSRYHYNTSLGRPTPNYSFSRDFTHGHYLDERTRY